MTDLIQRQVEGFVVTLRKKDDNTQTHLLHMDPPRDHVARLLHEVLAKNEKGLENWAFYVLPRKQPVYNTMGRQNNVIEESTLFAIRKNLEI